ncbi:ABC transporter ATP-binding protein [Peptoniphilus lacrimalis]|uniref:Daunorubicin/doxorubicin resistance ATP-binding protein DrrA n=1 Tax=Peptoniphilus lacrimalis TaxID=33031 RepID=A0A379C467_9FIRM|nr:ATP-binding cassette domain-containing protein [Peptoniphilus lacrimalis]SUB56909.1 Daunorubicin/doxorubicin resistance ATP-binding protein DrrA [Peptoniphilus lacrimalis]
MNLELKGISKSYGNARVIDEINIEINNGIYALLGHNGAGKSTVIKILLGLLLQDKGKVIYNSKSNTKGSVYDYPLGYVPQKGGLDELQTVRDFLTYVGCYKGMRIKEIERDINFFSDLFNFNKYLNVKIKKLSGGTKQKVKITQAFLNNPKLVVLDEPSVGLDIYERKKLKEFLSKYGENNTVIISTHIISDIDYIANNIIILKNGKIIIQGKTEDLINQIPKNVYKIKGTEKQIDEFISKNNVLVMNRSYENSNINVLRFMSERDFGIDNITNVTFEDIYTYYQKVGG